MNLHASMKVMSLATVMALALAATQAQAMIIEDNFDRANADLSASPQMTTAGYEWEIAANTSPFVEEFKPLIQSNQLRVERVTPGSSKDFQDTMFVTESSSGDVLQVADGRAKIQLLDIPRADIDASNNQFISFNYRTADTNVEQDTDSGTAGNQFGSQYGYVGLDGYHGYFRTFNDTPGTSMQVALVYRNSSGPDNFIVANTWATTPGDFPTNPWLEVEWDGDQHTLTLYEDDGSTVYFTDSGTDSNRSDGYFGVSHGLWDDSTAAGLSPPLDNFELEIIPEPASVALLGLGGLAMLTRRGRRQD